LSTNNTNNTNEAGSALIGAEPFVWFVLFVDNIFAPLARRWDV
jgi:hypothetical protein